MPCDQIIRQTVDFAAAKGHQTILVRSLEELGYSVEVQGDELRFKKVAIKGTYRAGSFDVSTQYNAVFDADEVKRTFARNVVKNSAKEMCWKYVQLAGNKFELHKNRL